VQLDDSAELDASVGTTKDVFEELLSHQLLLQMYGSISEVSLLVAGRSPVSWWPPDNLPSRGSASGNTGLASRSSVASGHQSPTRTPAGGQGAGQHGGVSAIAAAAVEALAASTQGSKGAAAAAGGGGSSSSARLLVPLEEEVDLVAIKFQGAQVGVTVSGDGFSTEVAMAALTIDDLLVGAKNPDKAHMARSSIVCEQQPKAQSPTQQQGLPQQQQAQQGTAAGIPAPAGRLQWKWCCAAPRRAHQPMQLLAACLVCVATLRATFSVNNACVQLRACLSSKGC
jgi:hypothetical protein